MISIKILLNSFLFLLIIAGCGEIKNTNEINASGTIEATDVVVSSKTAGQIEDIAVKEGDKVSKDDLLVVLDHKSLDIQLRQMSAGIEQAEAQLRLLQSGARKEDIALAKEQVKTAKINLDQALTDKERLSKLLESNTITQKQFEDASVKYELAQNQYNTARQNLLKVSNIVRPEEIESSKANLKRNQVGLEIIQKNIEDCTVKSPLSGIVTKKFVEAGEYVTPGSSLLKLSDLSIVNFYIYINETDLGKIKLGQKAEVKTDSYKDKIYGGEVIFISPEAEFTPKNIQTPEERTKLVFKVKIQIPNPDSELKSGMPADAKLIIN
ncbi:MAG: efflux RND transporter periplasmic adaptor subunit [Bacteroidetes bacterium]|nr:efflux RND transporter periplasmic adaptor subunit [Bacteroidota bacterium]